ncbi:MAG: aminotransferase class I/II-fold pyridoxal phosphate-dependent enzyme [Pseudomonadota bacterium]
MQVKAGSLIARRMGRLGTENAFKVGTDIAACVAAGMDVIKLNLGEPDFDSCDIINKRGIEEIGKGNSHYCDPQGLGPFRETIARQVSETRGVDVTPDRVVVTTGAKPPIFFSLTTFVNEGEEVIYPSPGFPIYESVINFLGARPVPLHLQESKGFRFTADELEPLITPGTKMIIINSPSNPTGGVLTPGEIKDIAGVIRTKCRDDIRVYSDEVYEHIVFDGLKHSSIMSEKGMAEKTIMVSGHSKTYAMTGWRLGYAVLPTREEAEFFKHMNINILSCVPPFIQMAGKEAMDNPGTKPIVEHMTGEFQARRDWVVDGLNAIDGVTCARPQGAFYVFPNIGGALEKAGLLQLYEDLPADAKRKTSPSTIFQMFTLYTYGVATMDRNSFGRIGAEGKHFLRLSTANSLEQLKKGVGRIEKALKDADGLRKFVEKGEHLG